MRRLIALTCALVLAAGPDRLPGSAVRRRDVDRRRRPHGPDRRRAHRHGDRTDQGTACRFRIAASNAVGRSPWSVPSPAVTPLALTLKPEVDDVFVVRAVSTSGKGLLSKAVKLGRVNARLGRHERGW